MNAPARGIDGARFGGGADAVQQRASARRLADDFERMFVQQMVAAMRETAHIGDDEGGMFGAGPGSDTYAQWFDQNLSDKVARGGRIGIADLLMKDFERNGEIPKAAPAATAAPKPTHPAVDGAARQGGIDVDA